MHRLAHLTLFAALTLLLGACGAPTGGEGDAGGTMTPSETSAVMDDFVTDGESMEADAEASTSFRAAMAFTALPRPWEDASTSELRVDAQQSTADEELPRGEYVWNGSAWDEAAHSDLRVAWPFDDASGTSHDASLHLDWDAGGSTQVVVDTDDVTYEAPTGSDLTFAVDGATLGALTFEATWRDTACGTLAQPTRLYLDGSFGDDSGKVQLDAWTFTANAAGDVATSGDVTATTPSEAMTFGWDLSLAGTWSTTDCFWTDYDVDAGSVELSAGNGDHDATFAFDFSDVRTDDAGHVESVSISNGRLAFAGTTAVTFDGTFDQPAGDDLPGANLRLRFDGETTTLKAFLEGELATTARTLGALSTLGGLF